MAPSAALLDYRYIKPSPSCFPNLNMEPDKNKLASIKLHPAVIVVSAVLIVSGEQSRWPLGFEPSILGLLQKVGRGLF